MAQNAAFGFNRPIYFLISVPAVNPLQAADLSISQRRFFVPDQFGRYSRLLFSGAKSQFLRQIARRGAGYSQALH
jgi:hypothetical protein